jgi:hypothetical protein
MVWSIRCAWDLCLFIYRIAEFSSGATNHIMSFTCGASSNESCLLVRDLPYVSSYSYWRATAVYSHMAYRLHVRSVSLGSSTQIGRRYINSQSWSHLFQGPFPRAWAGKKQRNYHGQHSTQTPETSSQLIIIDIKQKKKEFWALNCEDAPEPSHTPGTQKKR